MSAWISQIKRYELKYAIDEGTAKAIREHIRGICSLDRHAFPELGGYVVNNLYFETRNFRFYYDTKFRKQTRFKPRVRYYGLFPEDYAWLELKYRTGSVIWKTRRAVPIDQWPGVLEPRLSDRNKTLIKKGPHTFEEVVELFAAEPVLHVRYFREPYVTDLENYGRVTFDRRLASRLARGSPSLIPVEEDMSFYDNPVTTRHHDSPVILEIKVETLVPAWAIGIIRKFGLVQRGFSKYCYGIDNHGEQISREKRFALASIMEG